MFSYKITPMKKKLFSAAIPFSLFLASAGADEFKSVPVLIEDLASVVDLETAKYEIEFSNKGVISLNAKGFENETTHTLEKSSQSASLTIYYERGLTTEGKPSGFDKLHYWISTSAGGKHSYLTFKSDDAVFGKVGFEDGVFSIVYLADKNKPTEECYSLRVSSTSE